MHFFLATSPERDVASLQIFIQNHPLHIFLLLRSNTTGPSYVHTQLDLHINSIFLRMDFHAFFLSNVSGTGRCVTSNLYSKSSTSYIPSSPAEYHRAELCSYSTGLAHKFHFPAHGFSCIFS